MITVFGSINSDLVVSVERLPGPGETVKGPDYQVFPGGKGANQALAARRAGAQVNFVGAVGRDGFASVALAGLEENGVHLRGLHTLDGPTGVALIAVDARGENQIVVASGVNSRIEATWISALLKPEDVLLVQLEVPLAQTLAAVKRAQDLQAVSILNAAPAQALPRAALAPLSILIVNEHESALIAAALGLPAAPAAFASAISDRFETKTVVTLGQAGAILFDGAHLLSCAAPPIRPVDTTGAGDAFAGAFAAAIDGKRPFARALAEGVAAGSLACLQTGAQTSLPDAAAIRRMADEFDGA